jgi:hypothetical protein
MQVAFYRTSSGKFSDKVKPERRPEGRENGRSM